MKLKISAILLILASGFIILRTLYYFMTYQFYISEGTISLIIPVALIFLGISLLTNKQEIVEIKRDTFEKVENNKNSVIPTVGDWLIIFLISIIPLIGLIFLIIWANDDTHKVRKNYAIATLIWWGITILFTIILLTTIFSALMNELF